MTAVAPELLLDRLAGDEAATGSRSDRGRRWLTDHGLPSSRDEAWKYTPLDEVAATLAAAQPASGRATDVSRGLVDDLAGHHGGPRLVYVNGVFAPALSDLDVEAPGVWLGGADGLRHRPRPASGAAEMPVDGFHALNWAAGGDVAAVLVDPDVHLDRPVHVVHVSVPGGGITAVHPRTVVRAGERSELHLVESYVGVDGHSDGAALTNASTRVVAGAGSRVAYHRIQTEPGGAVHIARVAVEQSSESHVRATSVMTGARIARVALDVRLDGAGARADLDGLYLPSDQQRHDTVVTVDHKASHCTSTQTFKGIVDDHGRGSFSGHVVVRPDTVDTDARQTNHNLVLCPTAQADTRPWLEIYADDVRCTHGSTVGRLDDDALFYLRSRGIPLDRARGMLVAAFAAEVIDGIRPASLRDVVVAGCGALTPEGDA